tara:strand:- start:292 stop:621 length:330 start_codon:yes stop_codon:yes gene_type:complete
MTTTMPDIEEQWNPSDLDIGAEVAVRGILRGSELPGVLYMTRKKSCWEQRGRWTTAHLNCEYVCKERLDDILEKWIPRDFKDASASILRDSIEKRSLWSGFEDGTLPWR